ncbi:hypothetical protein [Ramlibacter sp.]|uniref:hypothetical protein n=1 Tax=Ramlibacter sp. TaxID=1917967 RepID=UPI002BF3CC95|nr:hypothetical protein [Ramlibacter sp.]HWI83663.1 hypothetical protein [Ramlibacter sp.]
MSATDPTSTDLATGVTGKIIRFSWTDGPTKGAAHVHVFHEDGTVEWHSADQAATHDSGRAGVDRPAFADEAVASGVRLISYLSSSGFTLTVVLNSLTGRIAGIASNEKTWVPVHGFFELVPTPGP